MKKQALNCQKAITEIVETEHIKENFDLKESLSAIQEGINVCISKVPSKKGFPFDLPAVEYVDKLYLSNNFFKTSISTLKNSNIQPHIETKVQELQSSINDFLCSGISDNIREIKTLNTHYVRLRQILSEEDQSSKQVKGKIKLLNGKIKKRQLQHPKLQVITKRIKMYNHNLFHCYDDKRIPRTNLEIERSFNSLKRILRKRTGFQKRPNFLSHEGYILIKIENITLDFKNNFDEKEFISHFQAQKPVVQKENLQTKSQQRRSNKNFLKRNFLKKISLKKAGKIFRGLRAKLG